MKFLKNIGYSWFSQIIVIAAQLIKVPILYGYLGDTVNVWFLLNSMLGFIFLFDLGLTYTIMRFYARSLGAANKGCKTSGSAMVFSINEIAETSRLIFRYMSIGGPLILCFIGSLYLLSIESTQKSLIITVWIVLVVFQGLTFFSMQYSSLLMADGQVGKENLIKAVGGFFSVGILWLLLVIGFGMWGVVASESFRVIGINIALRHYASKTSLSKEFLSAKPHWEPKVFKTLFQSAWKHSLHSIIYTLLTGIDAMLIGYFIGVSIVANYVNTQMAVNLAGNIVVTLTSVGFPIMLKYVGAEKHDKYKETLINILGISVLLYAMGMSVMFFSGRFLFELWLGEDNFIGSALLLLFIISQFFELHNYILMSSFYVKEDIPFWKINFISVGIRFLLILILVKNFGVYAIIISKIMSFMVIYNWYVVLGTWKNLNMRFSDKMFYSIVKVYSPIIILPMSGWLFASIASLDGWMNFVCLLVINVLVSSIFYKNNIKKLLALKAL